MKYCTRCVMPDTKPDLFFDKEGVCDACRSFENRAKVDWQKREQQLIKILHSYKKKSQGTWNCIVPVSGGKDSHYQVIKMLEYGMNPLCVTSTTCSLSEIGRKNIENLKSLGVDFIEFTTKPNVRKKINRFALEQVGDISWPEHVGIFTIPVQIAVRYKIPLLIWGESSQNEYGGPASARQDKFCDRKWLEEFGGLLGLRVDDLLDFGKFKSEDVYPFIYPEDKEIKSVGVSGIFLGYYLPWDGYRNLLLAQGFGFNTFGNAVEGALVNYENLDNYQNGIHDYFKFLKFGFSRATDQICLHLRRGRLNRTEAVALVKRCDGKFPWTYLGQKLETTLDRLDLSLDEFIGICDKFTNKKIFKTDRQGNLIKDKFGNLTLKEPIS